MSISKPFLYLSMFFLMSCSASYELVKKIDTSDPKTFHEHLLYNYKQNASFEADQMHDWNSAKLYSEKAIRASEGKNIYPEKINYWKITPKKAKDIRLGYNNLLSIYDDALNKDHINLAKAISSLDCWAEQEEEKWQTWDIDKCKNDFHTAMHAIYNTISNVSDKKVGKKAGGESGVDIEENKSDVLIVTQNKNKEVMQIIYFDFDNFTLSEVSKNKLVSFLDNNKKNLNRYIILGHADTKGTKQYNLNLSLKRAEAVKEILLNQGIPEKHISVLGKGENQLAVFTPDETKHPANRRAEIKILN